MVECPHAGGMIPVNAGDILHIFAHMRPEQRPELYRLADWPQLFFVCFQCGDKAPPQYELMTRDEAHAWAREHTSA